MNYPDMPKICFGLQSIFEPLSFRSVSSTYQRFQRFGKYPCVVIDVRLGCSGRHERHVVKWCQQNSAIHCIQVHEALQLEVHGVVRFAAVPGTITRKKIFRAATEADYVPG